MSYSSFAFYYDGLTRNVPYEKLAEYLLEVLKRHGHTPRLSLDLACGTGSLTIALAKKGVDIYGIDGSMEMLSRMQKTVSTVPKRSIFCIFWHKNKSCRFSSAAFCCASEQHQSSHPFRG